MEISPEKRYMRGMDEFERRVAALERRVKEDRVTFSIAISVALALIVGLYVFHG